MASIQSVRGLPSSRMRLNAASELAGTDVRFPLSFIVDGGRGAPQQYEMVSYIGTNSWRREMRLMVHSTIASPMPGATSRTRISLRAGFRGS